jgi:hypothetical protein
MQHDITEFVSSQWDLNAGRTRLLTARTWWGLSALCSEETSSRLLLVRRANGALAMAMATISLRTDDLPCTWYRWQHDSKRAHRPQTFHGVCHLTRVFGRLQ